MNLPEEILAIVGPQFSSHDLKSRVTRFKQAFHTSAMPKQKVKLLTCGDGRKYKLIVFDEYNVVRLEKIKWLHPILKPFSFVPNILHLGPYHLLVEFIEGQSPDITSDHFAGLFGQGMAAVYNSCVEYVPNDDLINDIKKSIGYLVEKGAMTTSNGEDIVKDFTSSMPNRIRTSLVYEDMTPYNLISASDDKRLYFIDFDSFTTGITGYFLFSSHIWTKINKDIFWENYLSAGGDQNLLADESLLTIICAIKQGANSLRLSHELPLREITRRVRRRRQAQKWIKKIIDYQNHL